MKHHLSLILGILLTLFLFTIPAQAGGWAVITLENLPEEVTIPEPLLIEMAVRQHGNKLTSAFGNPTVFLEHVETGEGLTVEAVPTGRTGYFSAELTFPKSGTWDWKIGIFGDKDFAQTMPRLEVQATTLLAVTTASQKAFSSPLAFGLIGFVTILGSLVVFFVTRTCRVLGVGLAGILLIVVGLAGVAQNPAVAASVVPVQPLSQVERGKALFLAKGCVVCHTHEEVKMTGFQTNMGPNLTHTKLSSEYIQTWLKDPSAIKSDTEMPNLNLKAVEMEALAAFLTAGQ